MSGAGPTRAPADPSHPGEPNRRDRVTARVAQARKRLEDARPDNPALDAVFRTVKHDAETGGGVLAGAVAFRLFLFMIPYGFVAVVGTGFAATAQHDTPEQLTNTAGVGGLLAKSVAGSTKLSGGHRWVALIGGVFALVLAARTVVKVLRVVHALIWRVPVTPAKRLTTSAFVLIATVTVGFGFAILVAHARSESLVGGLVATVFFVLIPAGAWLFVSMYLPHEDVDWRALVPGAVFVGVGFEILHLVTVYYIPVELSHKSATYGAIGTALVLLAWAYLLGRFLTASAALNAALYHRRQQEVSFTET